MNPSIKVWGLAVMVAVMSCIALADNDESEKWGKVTDEQWDLTAPAGFPEASAIVIFDNGSLEIPRPYEGNYIEYKRHVRIKIINKAGAEKSARMEIEGSDLRGFGAHTILRDGTKIEVAGKDRFVKKVGGEEITTFTFPALEDGCIIECKYNYPQDNFSLLAPWSFQSNLYTLKSKFTMTLWGGYDYSVQLANVPDSLRTPTRKELTVERMGPVEFSWTLRNLAPVETEPFMAAVSNYRASITCQLKSYQDLDNTLRFAKDWKTLGDKFLEYYGRFTGSRGDLSNTTKLLTASLAAPIDRVKRIFQYVRDEVLTQGDEKTLWFDKDNLGKVVSEKSGNCTEKNTLLVEMLKAAGLDASPVLIGTRDHAAFDPNLFMLKQFNHLICHVNCEGRSYLLDASNRGVPFPFLPPYDLTSGGLLLKKGASDALLSEFPLRRSAFETYTRMRVHADGSATCTTHVSLRGYQIHAKRDLLQERPTKDILNTLLLNNNTYQFEINSYGFSKEIDGDSANADAVLTFPSLGIVADQQLVCSLPFALWTDNPFSKPRRFFPIDFSYPRSYVHVLDLECDEGLTVAATPQNVNESMDGVNLSQTTLSAGKSARIMTQFIISKPVFPPGLYDKLREMFRKAADASAEPLTITL